MHGLCFVAWILLVCYMELQGAWSWFGCCNSGCCRLLELYLDVAIQDATDFVVWSWLGLHIQFLYFLQHLHLQMLDLDLCFIFIFRARTFPCSDFCTLRSIGIWFFLFFILLESLKICCWNWILVFESFVEFEFQIEEFLKFWF